MYWNPGNAKVFSIYNYTVFSTEYDDYSDTMLPEGIESVHPHYAISWRNNWMLRQADYVVTCITHTFGGEAQYAQKANRQQKAVINIANEKMH